MSSDFSTYLSLLTIENVLTENRGDPDRESFPVAERLIYVADREDGTGDNIGSYYHYFGTALISYAKGSSTVGILSALADEIPSFFLEPIDSHETMAGIDGAILGEMLRAHI